MIALQISVCSVKHISVKMGLPTHMNSVHSSSMSSVSQQCDYRNQDSDRQNPEGSESSPESEISMQTASYKGVHIWNQKIASGKPMNVSGESRGEQHGVTKYHVPIPFVAEVGISPEPMSDV